MSQPHTIAVQNFSHVCIGVSDIEASLAFYTTVLGMDVVFDVELDGAGRRHRWRSDVIHLRPRRHPDRAAGVARRHIKHAATVAPRRLNPAIPCSVLTDVRSRRQS